MAQTDTDAAAKITAAMFAQLLNKLVEKGVLEQIDVEQMMVEATKALQSESGKAGFEGLGGRMDDSTDAHQRQMARPGR